MSEFICFNVKVSGMVAKVVKERIESGKCLCCEGTAAKRGLCNRCYNAFSYVASKKNKRDRAAYEAKLISKGKLLDRYSAAIRKVKNIFEKFA